MNVINFLVENYQAIVAGVMGLISAVIAIALIIPGPEPESTLQKVLDFIAKFSKK